MKRTARATNAAGTSNRWLIAAVSKFAGTFFHTQKPRLSDMDKRLQDVVDAHQRTLKDQDLSDAAVGLHPKTGRNAFSLHQLLPPELADAAAEVTRELPSDPLTTSLMLLCGYSGLLKIGTRIQSNHRYSVPCNLFVAWWANRGNRKPRCCVP